MPGGPPNAVQAGHVQIKGSIRQTSSVDFTAIEGLSVPVGVNPNDSLMLTLSVSDTWSDTAGTGAWFQITVNGNEVARGLYTCGSANQRVPITLHQVVQAGPSDNLMELKVNFARFGSAGATYIGADSPTVLSWLRVPRPW